MSKEFYPRSHTKRHEAKHTKSLRVPFVLLRVVSWTILFPPGEGRLQSAEPFSHTDARAVDEVARTHALFAFELQFEHVERRPAAARDYERVAVRLNYFARADCPRAQVALGFEFERCRAPDDEAASVVRRVGVGPGLEAAHAALDVGGVERPVNKAVLAPEHGRERRLFVALRSRLYLVEARERLAQKVGPRVRESFEQPRRGLALFDCRGALQEQRACVESFVNEHRRHAGFGFAAHD